MAFVGNLATTSYYIGTAGLTQVKVLGETPFVYRPGMATRRDEPVLAALLQKGLDAIPRHDRDAIYHNWVSIRYRHETDLGLLWRVLAGAALLTTLISWWAARLAREVALEVLRLLARGWRTREIAGSLGIGPKTVET